MPQAWRFAGAVAVAACGVLLVTSAQEADGEDFRGNDYAELSDLVKEAEDRAGALDERATELNSEIESLTEQQATESPATEQRLNDLREATALTPVTGPGVRVVLDDADVPVDTPNRSDYIVHQQDLEAVMNAMWAGGAEAMMVMDQRIISTSAVRCIGPVLHLQTRTYAPPYEVTAIGDVDGMLTALDDSSSVDFYRSLVEQFGLGFELTVEEEITMPAYEGTLGIAAESAV
ncbi:MAG: DUF881 domain-containing protein [Actinomycetota bacterium]